MTPDTTQEPGSTCLCGRRLTEGRRLCQGCTTHLDSQLAELPGLHAALAAHLQPGQHGFGQIGSAASHPPLPVSEPVLVLRGPGGMVQILEDWRAALHADLRWGAPVPAGDYAERLADAVAGLRQNLPRIAGSWPQAEQFAGEIRRLHGRVLGIVDPEEPTMRAGYCTAEIESGRQCGAPLRTRLRDPEIICPRCGRSYPPSAWLSLRASQAAA